MATEPLKVACIGMGWWSDVLACLRGGNRRFTVHMVGGGVDDSGDRIVLEYGVV